MYNKKSDSSGNWEVYSPSLRFPTSLFYICLLIYVNSSRCLTDAHMFPGPRNWLTLRRGPCTWGDFRYPGCGYGEDCAVPCLVLLTHPYIGGHYVMGRPIIWDISSMPHAFATPPKRQGPIPNAMQNQTHPPQPTKGANKPSLDKRNRRNSGAKKKCASNKA